ncbi:uncharacterized protein LOC129922909 [Biomphalaria glabrata]|uniref:Uncharacterized protein LOC129922909 n=1 Tax=Biomphalaria glabrata TaxID=6526 RepID=A0A9W2YWI5_BIOGL|nr:uncharacterized protein LOC129922909 [Biomphalaria glabrata]
MSAQSSTDRVLMMFLYITNVLLFIGVIAFSNKSLTIYKLDSVEGIGCQPWSLNVKVNKHLCWGGNVSFQNYSKDVGTMLIMTITLADPNIRELLSLINFDKCGKQLLKSQACACTSENGYDSFSYTCAKAFKTSDSGAIISVQIHDFNGFVVQEAILKLPLFSKEETFSNKSLTIYKLDSVEGVDCQPWSLNVKVNKHLCWGGNVKNYSKDVGTMLIMTITLADPNISELLFLINIDECGKQLLKLQVCACTSENGNDSFIYTCAKAFNTSDSGAIISVQIRDLYDHVVQEALLKLPPFSKEETFSNKSLTIYKLDSVEGVDCQPWSLNVKVNKHLCWGGNVSFQNYSKDIGKFLIMTLTLADRRKLLSITQFAKCGKQLLKSQVCACTSENGYDSFSYTCAKAFKTSESIISVQIYDNSLVVQEAILKLPSFSKEESKCFKMSIINAVNEFAYVAPYFGLSMNLE